MNPGAKDCSIGRDPAGAGGAWVCGPKHNDSDAPVPPPAPPAPAPTPPCPVAFGLSSGVLEPGTDHARANGLKGNRAELVLE
jgi:hypothetical protein